MMAVEINETPMKFKFICNLVKQQEEQKKVAKSIADLFSSNLDRERKTLVNECVKLLFMFHDSVGKKSREILWRKGYYDLISISKRNVRKSDKDSDASHHREKLRELLLEGISLYKGIAIEMEQCYDLDLRYLIDFSILDTNLCVKDFIDMNLKNQDKSLEAINYALETIHSSLLALGDLHRYLIEFNFKTPIVTKSDASKYYFEAFKLNPTIGMAQNQLGTLYSGESYDLDSIYYYIYSLICTVPFDLSENNLCKLFMVQADHLERLDSDNLEQNLQNVLAKFYLIVDIYFFDKTIPDFTHLCHSFLVDIGHVLRSSELNEEHLFKIICIILFCLSKLKMIKSQKVYSIISLLAAICSDLIDVCISELEQFIMLKKDENLRFQDIYLQRFDEFDKKVKKSREEYKKFYGKETSTKMNTLKPIICDTDTDSCKNTKKLTVQNGNHNVIRNNKENPNSLPTSDKSIENTCKELSALKLRKRITKMRRRRRKVNAIEENTDSESSNSENEEGQFSDEENNYSDFSSDVESNYSNESFNSDGDQYVSNDEERFHIGKENHHEQEGEFFEDDNEPDIIVLETEVVIIDEYTNSVDSTRKLYDNEEEEILIKNGEHIDSNEDKPTPPPAKLNYRNKYTKIDPNLIIEFSQNSIFMRSLKILFDWLRINSEILLGCYQTNPEFINKIMVLLNYFNIDIFTRKVYFDRELLVIPDVRIYLENLFNIRSKIPLSEDFILKNFDILQSLQSTLDWEVTIKENITKTEENIIRIFKMVDFGFFMCKMKKFNYNFCANTRRFIEKIKKNKNSVTKQQKGGGGGGGGCREQRKSRKMRRQRKKPSKNYDERKNNEKKSITGSSSSEKVTIESSITKPSAEICPRKSYLRNRERNNERFHHINKENNQNGKIDQPLSKEKCEIMGKLWLCNEIKCLESKMKDKPKDVLLTPYIVVDSKSLTEYTNIVKNLVKTKQFVVLIPNAVLSELDELKKHSEQSRNSIRWLEQEFSRGNRYLRSQRPNENVPLSMVKIPKKMDREESNFLQIAQFCNAIVIGEGDNASDVLTFLSGDSIKGKKFANINYISILDTISVRYDQITSFYSKYKNE